MRNLIFGLARPMLRLLGRDEEGAIGVLVAIFLAGGVLLGMGALVIDVGRLYQNRAELQNGADAGALAVAKSCASGSCNAGLAGSYANANASNLTAGQAAVDLVCGTGSLGAGCVSPLLACPPTRRPARTTWTCAPRPERRVDCFPRFSPARCRATGATPGPT